MAEKTALENFLTCCVCLDTFKEPVSLGCNHSFCRSCLQDFWDKNNTRNCPTCRRRSSKDKIIINFALKELCESFTEKLEVSVSPKTEAGAERAELPEEVNKLLQQLQCELQKLRAEKQSYEDLEQTYEEMKSFCEQQAVQSERAIRLEFSRLQTFLQEEEQRTLSALREEQLRQTHNMGSELQKVREKLTSLSNGIRELEKHLQTGSYSPQQQSPAPRLRPKAGLLLDQAKVLGNLGFRVWSNMRRMVSYSPVILDPNTAARSLCLSEDLRGVRLGDTWQNVPDNPERFSEYAEVLGSEGFSSGSHQWDVEVGDHPHWAIGVTKESVDREGEKSASPKFGIWALFHLSGKYTHGCNSVPVQSPVQRLKVKLDHDLGEVSFYDADHMTHLFTHTDTFTETIFPYFYVWKHNDAKTSEIRILPRATEEQSSEKEPSGTKPSGTKPSGTKPSGTKPSGAKPSGAKPSGAKSCGVKSLKDQCRR